MPSISPVGIHDRYAVLQFDCFLELDMYVLVFFRVGISASNDEKICRFFSNCIRLGAEHVKHRPEPGTAVSDDIPSDSSTEDAGSDAAGSDADDSSVILSDGLESSRSLRPGRMHSPDTVARHIQGAGGTFTWTQIMQTQWSFWQFAPRGCYNVFSMVQIDWSIHFPEPSDEEPNLEYWLDRTFGGDIEDPDWTMLCAEAKVTHIV